MIDVSKRIMEIEESPTMAVMAKAAALRAEGRDIVGFTVGEPDFDTPENIKEAAIRAIKDGKTKYTPVGGIPELKDAIIKKFERDNFVCYKRSEVTVSCGGKHSLYNLFQAILNPGDEVIVPGPYWVSYPPMVSLAGGTPVIIQTEDVTGFKLTPEIFSEYITSKTKAIILNSPSNPSGAAYSRDELRDLTEIALNNNILIISDEIYEKLVYDDFKFSSVASISPRVKENSVIVNGVSKAYAMTGWRIGYTAGPAHIIKAMEKLQGQSTSNPTSVSQWAAIEALAGPQESVNAMLQEFSVRRKAMVDGLNAIDGVYSIMPEGAFYAFPNVARHFGKSYEGKEIKDGSDIAGFLLDSVELAVVPGIAFGSFGHLRLSYACSLETIEEGLKRMEKAFSLLK